MSAPRTIPVYMLDSTRLDVPIRQDGLVSDLLSDALHTAGVSDVTFLVLRNCFSLCLWTDRDGQSPPLDLMEHAQDAFAAARADDPSSRAVLSLRLVTPGILGFANRDVALQHLLFATCALGVLTGSVPVEPPVALELGALVLHMRSGTSPTVGSLRDPTALRTILPSSIVARFAREQLEDELLARYRALPPLSATEAQAAYCTIVEDSDYFGVTAWPARQFFTPELPVDLYVGVTSEGVVLFDDNRAAVGPGAIAGRVLQRLPLTTLSEWSFEPPTTDARDGLLILHVIGERAAGFFTSAKERFTQRLAFHTADAPVFCDLLNEFVAQLVREALAEESHAKEQQAVPAEEPAGDDTAANTATDTPAAGAAPVAAETGCSEEQPALQAPVVAAQAAVGVADDKISAPFSLSHRGVRELISAGELGSEASGGHFL